MSLYRFAPRRPASLARPAPSAPHPEIDADPLDRPATWDDLIDLYLVRIDTSDEDE